MMHRPALTPRQQIVLDFIVEQIRRRGYAPSVREIGRNFGIRSTNGVVCTLVALAKKGYIRRDECTARSITVVGMGGDLDYGEAIDLLESAWHEHYAGMITQRWPTAVRMQRALTEAGRLKEEKSA